VKSICALLFVLLLLVSVSPAECGSSGSRTTDVYHVFFAKAALARARGRRDAEERIGSSCLDTTLSCATRAARTGIMQSSSIWEPGNRGGPRYCSTCWFSRTGRWHNDTFVSGPAWPEFSKAWAWTMQLAVPDQSMWFSGLSPRSGT